VTAILEEIVMRVYAGTAVECRDGSGGEVADLVVDPQQRRLTHLVVANHGHGSRLVPAEVMSASHGQVVLSWTIDQVLNAPQVEETGFLGSQAPAQGDDWSVGVVRLLPWPHYLAPSVIGYGQALEPAFEDESTSMFAMYDRIPAGTAEIRRVTPVVSRDDHVVGHVEGLVVDAGQTITQLIIDRGHLWTHREMLIPTIEIESMATDRIRLRVSRADVESAPSTPLRRHLQV
jgi:hypothetical protein